MCVFVSFVCLFIFIEIQNQSWTTGSSFFADPTSRNGSDPMVLNSLLSTESSRASTGCQNWTIMDKIYNYTIL